MRDQRSKKLMVKVVIVSGLVIGELWISVNSAYAAVLSRQLLAAYSSFSSSLDQTGDGKVNGLDVLKAFKSPSMTPTMTPAMTPTVTPTGAPGGVVLVGAGDIATAGMTSETTAKLLDALPNATIFTAGDNAYPDGTTANFMSYFDPTWGRHKSKIRPAPGNHDYHTAGAAGYYSHFGANAGPAGQGYYSYNLGDWHIVSLNSEVGYNPGSAQEQWLVADLNANTKVCTLAYWHHPLFSSGQHSSIPRMKNIFQILYDKKADVVVNGHDHLYERFAPQDANGQANSNGVREFIAGTGGAGLYSWSTIKANSEVRENTTHGVLKLTLQPTAYSWEFVPVAGKTFHDSGSANCVN